MKRQPPPPGKMATNILPIHVSSDIYASGFGGRDAYYRSLASDYDMTEEEIYAFADTFGPDEDFNLLPAIIHDMRYSGRKYMIK